MFAADEPYISDFFFETVNKNFYPVLRNDLTKSRAKCLIEDNQIKEIYDKTNKIYTNSENSLQRVINALKDTDLPSKINLFKDKTKTRELLKSVYPDFYYKKASFDELDTIKNEEINFPVVIKPNTGFLSLGVYTVWTKDELNSVISKIKLSMKNSEGLFPRSVLNADSFIIEEYIEGDEYAIDAYFDDNSVPVILNIFKHPFADKNDVSDRMYITSPQIIKENLSVFKNLLDKIGSKANLKNFPMHIEVRKSENKIIPIEVNPMRFCGWCISDITYFAYGINPYEYFMENKKPAWENIISDNNSVYAFVMCEVPNTDKTKIEKFETEKFKKFINAEIMETREFDFLKKPMFAVLFIKAENYDKIKDVLKADMNDFIKMKDTVGV